MPQQIESIELKCKENTKDQFVSLRKGNTKRTGH